MRLRPLRPSANYGRICFPSSIEDKGFDKGGLFCLKSLVIKEKNSKITQVTPMALSVVTRSSSSMSSWQLHHF